MNITTAEARPGMANHARLQSFSGLDDSVNISYIVFVDREPGSAAVERAGDRTTRYPCGLSHDLRPDYRSVTR